MVGKGRKEGKGGVEKIKVGESDKDRRHISQLCSEMGLRQSCLANLG